MKSRTIRETTLASMIGSILGSIPGLFAIGVIPAILEREPRLVLAHPTIGLLCFVVGGVFGWFVGGSLGWRLGKPHGTPQSQVTGGVIAGTLPLIAFLVLGWLLWKL